MLRFWFREDIAPKIIERYANWQFTKTEAFQQLSSEEQLRVAEIWIVASAIPGKFDVPGLVGCKAVEIWISSNGPNQTTIELFEELGGLYQGEFKVNLSGA